jgi:eukaryotic translation initiation factor 2C
MSDRGRSPGRPGGGGGSDAGRQSVQSPSRSQGPGPTSDWVQGPGHDPARPAGQRQEKGNTRLELPPDAYVSDTQKDKFVFRGNKFNTEGKPADMLVNQYRMTKFNFSRKIYQYDVSIMLTELSLPKVQQANNTRSPFPRTPSPL